MNKFAAIQALVANALTLFGDLKSAESSPWQSLVPRELFLPATRSLSRCCQDESLVSRSGGLGHQIWEVAPDFAATFRTGFSFQKIFSERLFSGIADNDETPTSPCPKAIRRRSRHLPFQLEEVSAPRCRSQLFLFYFRPQKPFSLG